MAETAGKSLKTNLFMNVIYVLASTLFPLIIFPYVSRVLGAEAFGRVNFFITIATVFIITSNLGIPTYGVRELARVRNDKEKLSELFNELFTSEVILMIVSLAIYLTVPLFFPRIRSDLLLLLITGLNIIFNIFGVLWLFQAKEDYIFITVRTIIVQTMSLVLIFLFVKQPSDYHTYAFITAFSTSVCNLYNFFHASKYVSISLTTPKRLLRHFKPVIIFFLTTAAIQAYCLVTVIFLGFIRDNEAVGYFTAAQKINTAILGVITSVSSVLLPRVSFYVKNHMWQEIDDVLAKTFSLILFISLPTCVLLYTFSSDIITVLCGTGFSRAISLSRILSPKILLTSVSTVIAFQILIPLGKEKYFLLSCLYGTVISVGTSLLLIPSVGETGSAIAYVVAEIVIAIALLYYAREFVLKYLFRVSNLNYLFAVIVPLPLTSLMKDYVHFPVMTLLTCSIVYGLMYYVILIMIRDTIAIQLLNHIADFLRRIIFELKR